MPNWCECDLKVTGDPTRVREFLCFAKGEEGGETLLFDFNRFLPYPGHFALADRAAAEWEKDPGREKRESRPEDGFNHGGYEWCLENWGTKWNARRAALGEEADWGETLEVVLHFDTAWSPPLPVIGKASELFPDLEFELRYFECGAELNGCFRCEGGEVVFDETGVYFGNRGG